MSETEFLERAFAALDENPHCLDSIEDRVDFLAELKKCGLSILPL